MLFVLLRRFQSLGDYLPWKMSGSVLPRVESSDKRHETGDYCGHTSHKCIFVLSWQTKASFFHSFIYLTLGTIPDGNE